MTTETKNWKLPLFNDQDRFDPIQAPLNLLSADLERAMNDFAARATPIGTIMAFGGTEAPEGYLLCDGASYNRGTYGALYAVIGGRFGAPSATLFSVPDTLSRVLVGVESGSGDMATIGQMGGEKQHTLTTNEMPKHTHGYSWGQAAATAGVGAMYANGFENGRQSDPAGGGAAHNVLQPYVTVNYIIKHGKV